METPFTFMQSATVTATTIAAVPVEPNTPVTIPSQTQKMSGYCATCTPLGKQCLMTCPMHLKPNWSNLEREEDWNSDKQEERILKELELKGNNITEPQSPQYQSRSTTDTDETELAQKHTDTLVPTTEEKQKEEDDVENNSENDSETDYNSDDTLENIV